jgi:hypothetical protein
MSHKNQFCPGHKSRTMLFSSSGYKQQKRTKAPKIKRTANKIQKVSKPIKPIPKNPYDGLLINQPEIALTAIAMFMGRGM